MFTQTADITNYQVSNCSILFFSRLFNLLFPLSEFSYESFILLGTVSCIYFSVFHKTTVLTICRSIFVEFFFYVGFTLVLYLDVSGNFIWNGILCI